MNLVQIDNRTQTEPQTGGCGLGEPVQWQILDMGWDGLSNDWCGH